MQDLRVQALRGGSNSPTSRCPETRSIGLCVKLQGVRTLVPVEGGGLYRVCQTPPALSYIGFNVHKGMNVTGNASIKVT